MSTSLIYHTQGLRDCQYATKKHGDGKRELERLQEMFSHLGTASFMKECLRRIYSIAENRNAAEIAFEYWLKLQMKQALAVSRIWQKNKKAPGWNPCILDLR